MMDKKQAFSKLALDQDTDPETIRMRFAARYSQNDHQYDLCLTKGMKAIHEIHLQELEQAYKLITDNPVISDMGALLSLGKGYIEAEISDNPLQTSEKAIATDEALAFFALDPDATPQLAQQRFAQYISELNEALSEVGLEASKEPFRIEIAKAEACLPVAVNYLLAGQLIAEQQLQCPPNNRGSNTYSTKTKPRLPLPVASFQANKKDTRKSKKLYTLLIISSTALLTAGFWIGNTYSGHNKLSADADTSVITQSSLPDTHTRAAAKNKKPANTGKIKSLTGKNIKLPPVKSIVKKPILTPYQRLQTLLLEHTNGFTIQVTEDYIQFKGEKRYLLPYQNILSINNKGEFTGIDLIVEGKGAPVTKGLAIVNITDAVKKEIMEAIRHIKPARQLSTNTIKLSTPDRTENMASTLPSPADTGKHRRPSNAQMAITNDTLLKKKVQKKQAIKKDSLP